MPSPPEKARQPKPGHTRYSGCSARKKQACEVTSGYSLYRTVLGWHGLGFPKFGGLCLHICPHATWHGTEMVSSSHASMPHATAQRGLRRHMCSCHSTERVSMSHMSVPHATAERGLCRHNVSMPRHRETHRGHKANHHNAVIPWYNLGDGRTTETPALNTDTLHHNSSLHHHSLAGLKTENTHDAFWKLDREDTASLWVWNTNFNRAGSCGETHGGTVGDTVGGVGVIGWR